MRALTLRAMGTRGQDSMDTKLQADNECINAPVLTPASLARPWYDLLPRSLRVKQSRRVAPQ